MTNIEKNRWIFLQKVNKQDCWFFSILVTLTKRTKTNNKLNIWQQTWNLHWQQHKWPVSAAMKSDKRLLPKKRFKIESKQQHIQVKPGTPIDHPVGIYQWPSVSVEFVSCQIIESNVEKSFIGGGWRPCYWPDWIGKKWSNRFWNRILTNPSKENFFKNRAINSLIPLWWRQFEM